MKLHYDAEGAARYYTMTRREFFATHADFRNKPGRSGVPMRLALCPKHGTVSVQVTFTCEHGTPEKVACKDC